MSTLTLSCVDLAAVLRGVATDLQECLEELRELDAALGDGDLGITVLLAAGVIGDPGNGDGEDIGMMLATLGARINKVSPSTFGTLLASAFLGAGTAVRGKSAITAADLVPMGQRAVEAIKKRGKADVGDKTMLDALIPAVEVFKQESERDAENVEQSLSAAVVAAEKGMNATAGMLAKFGRASWRREESVGFRDAGAAAMYHIIRLFVSHVSQRCLVEN